MAIEVFNRYEKKYILDEHTFRRLLERINDYMEPDKYNLNGQFYSICNIYYDTDDNRLKEVQLRSLYTRRNSE